SATQRYRDGPTRQDIRRPFRGGSGCGVLSPLPPSGAGGCLARDSLVCPGDLLVECSQPGLVDARPGDFVAYGSPLLSLWSLAGACAFPGGGRPGARYGCPDAPYGRVLCTGHGDSPAGARAVA